MYFSLDLVYVHNITTPNSIYKGDILAAYPNSTSLSGVHQFVSVHSPSLSHTTKLPRTLIRYAHT